MDDRYSYRHTLLKKLSDGLILFDKFLTRKKLCMFLAVVLAVLLAVFGVRLYNAKTESPFEYAEKASHDMLRAMYIPEYGEKHYEVKDEETGYTFVFYFNHGNRVLGVSRPACCMVLEDTFFGYKDVTLCEIPVYVNRNDGKTGNYMVISLPLGNESTSLYWGYVLNDYADRVQEVYLGDMKCNIASSDEYEYDDVLFFWHIGDFDDDSTPDIRTVKASQGAS